MKALTGWVGKAGNGPGNRKREVVRIQAMLNLAPPDLGGPEVLLKLDDIVGPKTIGAIERFQSHHSIKKDGRVDPDGPTARALAAMEGRDNATTRVLRPSIQMAFDWLSAAIALIDSTLEVGPKPKDEVPPFARRVLRTLFKVTWNTPERNETAATESALRPLLRVFYQARSNLQSAAYNELENIEQSHDLTRPSAIAPVVAGPVFPRVGCCFREPDLVNMVGAGLQHRAAALLLAAIDIVGYADSSGGGIDAGRWQDCFSDRESAWAYRDPATYLFLCQLAAGKLDLNFIVWAGYYGPLTRMSPPLKSA